MADVIPSGTSHQDVKDPVFGALVRHREPGLFLPPVRYVIRLFTHHLIAL